MLSTWRHLSQQGEHPPLLPRAHPGLWSPWPLVPAPPRHETVAGPMELPVFLSGKQELLGTEPLSTMRTTQTPPSRFLPAKVRLLLRSCSSFTQLFIQQVSIKSSPLRHACCRYWRWSSKQSQASTPAEEKKINKK